METCNAGKTLEKIRFQSIKLFLAGTSPTGISFTAEYQLPPVFSWIRLFRKGSWDGIRAKPHKGRPKTESPDRLNEIQQFFANHPNAQGTNPKLWTGPENMPSSNPIGKLPSTPSIYTAGYSEIDWTNSCFAKPTIRFRVPNQQPLNGLIFPDF